MPTSLMNRDEQDMSRGFRMSIVFHTAVVLTIFIKIAFMPSKNLALVPTLRVDVIGLPDLLKKDLSKVGTPPAQKEEPKPVTKAPIEKAVEKASKDEMVLNPKKTAEKAAADEKKREKKLKSALERIKALDKIQNQEEKKGTLIKGNKLSQGTSLSADAKESDQSNYYDAIRDKLVNNWELPVWIARQKLSAQVQLYIDSAGRVRDFKFVRKSGNVQFDDAVKRTIIQSQPFTVPPQSIMQAILADGILVGFPL